MPSVSTEPHAREVVEMMRDSGKFYTRESLAAAIAERFGADARFRTCSGQELTAIRLVEHLASHGKLVRFAGGFTIAAEVDCQH